MAPTLNLNNEVVKMRREVKKVRVLTIRKLTRHIAKLKAKKGTEDAVLKNHKRAQRLLEEIHAMKEIKPDQVTKLALGGEINFELVCKKPDSTATDRALARLTTHPLLRTKIADIKAAVKAFKDARRKPARPISAEEHKSEEELTKQPEVTQHSNINEHNQVFKQGKVEVGEKSRTDKGKKQICKKEKQKNLDSEKCPSDGSTVQALKDHELVHKSQLEMTVCPERKEQVSDLLYRAEDESDSDASNTEEKAAEEEYFDDSTEERFYNQSSGSDESDDNDDFFIGKAKRIKKKGAADLSSLTEDKDKSMVVKETKYSQFDPVQDSDIQGSYPNAKIKKLQSVFYPSLSNSEQKSKTVKRTSRDHLSKNKMMAFQKKCPQKRLSKSIGTKQDLKRERLAQPLHPSWEASRKRREQTSQITLFQGKKIIFED
ncbi:serum response factor-binding protein 1 isoform X2 [Eublepharis macularius]|uniref:Serum response factor-binding protein 1 isoform X2 n=1 Tax=Eublepharis macularius TaxID=481883 RepID=A0AA97JQF2_EUBMA|nr:serum response factor-binding protein 1 isoform X2 [Eublepharis macularius]